MDAANEIENAVHQLKMDRDTWQAIALRYKTAFNSQTARLRELQDICVATQAELENERAQYRRLRTSAEIVPHDRSLTLDSDGQSTVDQVVPSDIRVDMSWKSKSSNDGINPLFRHVEQLASHLRYGAALSELDKLLRGPLSPKARAEGLLLKSRILHAIGPDSILDALAACSEALELCNRISELQMLLPKIQYQRGQYYYKIGMLQQAREAFEAVSDDNLLFDRAKEYRQSCDDGNEMLHFDRRSAFDESRSVTGGLFAELEDGSSLSKLRRTSAQFKHRATQKVKRMSLPHRWMSPAADEV
ncbi:hypothetical protein SVAN01_03492 [Stagonosporopsis vannaccii]|nr:hypothetical protein SVAN01_03492 [Stagonosporopsis vannaccii]